jgi:type I restriction enzyme M protein
MNQKQIKQLEATLWDSADNLRANSKLTAAEYKDPVLGLILLRYAQNRYEQAKQDIEAKIPETHRGKRKPTEADYLAAGAMMLPEKSLYDHLANLSEADDISEAVNTAMRLIEDKYPDLAGVLPRNYQELNATLLRDLIRVFNKDAVKNLTGDVFGRIYEYFLMKFSMSGAGAQEGGEFFTPPSLVQMIVNLIQPDHGTIHDPACGSGGMFVQTGKFIKSINNQTINEAITCYGTELKSNNTRLAKMNLAMHGIEGKIIESNSFYSDPHDLIEQCDFVMANPPFNVKKVDKKDDFVKSDSRLFDEVGIPKADNGNYLWIQYFYHYLNAKGRAGFVMASSATDAGNTEKKIRIELIETGAVDCIISVGNNFFYTLSLPCHLWFLDKGKREQNKDKILMIDARNTFRKVNTKINDFSAGQLRNFQAIMQAYRGDKSAIKTALNANQADSIEQAKAMSAEVNTLREALQKALQDHDHNLLDFEAANTELKQSIELNDADDYSNCEGLLSFFEKPANECSTLLENYQTQLVIDKKSMLAAEKKEKKRNTALRKQLEAKYKILRELEGLFKDYNQKVTESSVGEPLYDYKQSLDDWKILNKHFPKQQYKDIEGLCKVVDLAEIKENDYSLTPGRYVGYSIQIDMDFDYQGRMDEIHKELAGLNSEANELMKQIQGVSI